MSEPIPFFVPDITPADIEAVVKSLESGWLTSGPRVREFEGRFAEYVGARHAIAVNSCTAAMHLALAAAGIGSGDEVILPTMTFAATAEVVLHLGATPVLVDVNDDTLTMDPTAVKRAITERTKALMPVHYGGYPCDMDSLLELARSSKLIVIEDAAHALPTSYRGRRVGNIGDVTCFSFYANKTITSGEGGMITTDDGALADRMRSLSLHGLSADAWKRFESGSSWDYKITAAGFKYNLTDSAAALGLSQLSRADDFRSARAKIAERYSRHFEGMADVRPLVAQDEHSHAWHLFVIRVEGEGRDNYRNQLIDDLGAANIGTSVHWRPLHLHPFYRKMFGFVAEDFPVASGAFEKIVSLPIYPRMRLEQVDDVVEAIGRSLHNRPG